MGDMADWTNDQMQEANPGWLPVGASYRGRRLVMVSRPACRNCGKPGLNWTQRGSQWRLYEGTTPHICHPAPDAEGFTTEDNK